MRPFSPKVASLGLLILAACSDATSPTIESNSAVLVNELAAQASPHAEMAAMASRVPGFAGWYFDEEGFAVIRLTDLRQSENAANALRAHIYSRHHGRSVRGTRFEAAAFDALQLSAWFDAVDGVIARLPGFVLVDLDEQANSLTIGITGEMAWNGIKTALLQRGIPESALRFVVTSVPKANQETILGRVRPIAGGVKFSAQIGPGVPGCTASFNVGVGATHLLVNSHCTPTMWGGTYDDFSTNYWQPANIDSEDFIGWESSDPPGTYSGGCPTSSSGGCRYSDAALLSYWFENPTRELGKIARLHVTGDPTAPTYGDRYTIQSEVAYSVVGTFLSKVGITTGLTQGSVGRTCVNVWNDLNRYLFCQNGAAYNAGPGDSGSPVFSLIEQNVNGVFVALHGVHWGEDLNGYSYYSPMGSVERDLGPLTTY